MQINNFKDMYIAELQELFSMEGQFAAALEKMAEVATHPTLKTTLLRHRDAVDVQMHRLESILQKHGADQSTHTDQAMQMPHAHRTKIFRDYSVGVRHSKDLPAATASAFAAQLLAPSRINSSVNEPHSDTILRRPSASLGVNTISARLDSYSDYYSDHSSSC